MSEWNVGLTDEDIVTLNYQYKIELIVREEDGFIHVEAYRWNTATPEATLQLRTDP